MPYSLDLQVQIVSTVVLKEGKQSIDRILLRNMEPYPETVIRDLPAYCSSSRAIWRTRAPLLFFCVVEMYNPDRVLRQFGLRQRIPPLQRTSIQLHKIDLRGKTDKDWSAEHSAYVCMWNERASNIATDEILEESMDFYNPNGLLQPYSFYFRIGMLKILLQSAFECPISFKP
ncbi:hypothetical protein Syun_006230 [Stephania yunnanensis]|uniref:Aminotransferase-like plant mobile domain-containing protein n=1 Tax=Stephania yunnanensis TaxID=152371 RepID=A0AAP0KXV4_9MAGN